MEILLIACLLAYTAGAQSEKTKMGVSPAQRAVMRENTRHEKAVQKIADKHGMAPPAGSKAGVSPWKEAPAPTGVPTLTLPEALRSGYRGHSPLERVATPMGRRVGGWAARGVAWGEDTGKGALREYRRRRRAGGYQDPAPVLVPLPPTIAPTVPPVPAVPPTVPVPGSDTKGVSMKKPTEPEKPPEAPKPEAPKEPAKPEPTKAPPEPVVEEPAVAPTPTPPEPPVVVPAPTTDTEPAPAGGGVGRMAAEVSYESVADESDELSIMCDDDARVYDRVRARSEREVGRADTLMAELHATGFGPKVISWVARCKENYGVILSEVDGLKANTIAQGEKVVQAKAYLEAGQGVYADIAKDMESVADRGAYISDVVDAEDTSAHTEIYETKAAV